MNTRTILIILTLYSSSAFGDDWYNRWINSGYDWHSRWTNLANQASSMQPEERIEILGKSLGVGSKPEITKKEEEVYFRIQNILINTPGHAEYYIDRVKKAQQRYAELTDIMDDRLAPRYERYYQAQSDASNILPHLPSTETVRVTGELLSDTWQYPGIEKYGDRERTNGGMAYTILSSLPLIDPPPKYHSDSQTLEEVLAPWQQWYAEIKAGKRTFRFKGDPNEYNLDGPIRTAKNSLPSRGNRPDSPFSSPSRIAGIVALLAAIALGWLFLKKRKTS